MITYATTTIYVFCTFKISIQEKCFVGSFTDRNPSMHRWNSVVMALQTAPRMVSWSHSCSKRQVEHLWPLPDLSVWAARGTSWERCTSAHGSQAKEACSSISAPQTSFPVCSLIYSGLCNFPVTVCNSNKFLSLNLLFWNLPQVQFIMFLRNISRPCRQTPVQCCIIAVPQAHPTAPFSLLAALEWVQAAFRKQQLPGSVLCLSKPLQFEVTRLLPSPMWAHCESIQTTELKKGWISWQLLLDPAHPVSEARPKL